MCTESKEMQKNCWCSGKLRCMLRWIYQNCHFLVPSLSLRRLQNFKLFSRQQCVYMHRVQFRILLANWTSSMPSMQHTELRIMCEQHLFEVSSQLLFISWFVCFISCRKLFSPGRIRNMPDMHGFILLGFWQLMLPMSTKLHEMYK